MTKKRSIINKKRISKRSKKGGKAMGAGSFGCVFIPALKCKDPEKNINNINKVSKLLLKKDADDEMEVINNVKDVLYEIPNNDLYFIPNSKMPFIECEIDEFSDADLNDILKCTNIAKFYKKIKKKNWHSNNISNIKNFIKEYKNSFRIIQQENGGNDFSNFINYLSPRSLNESIHKLVINICDLMVNGIAKMNEKGLLHLDLKPENMVIKSEVRIIDWGFAKNVSNYTLDNILNNIENRIMFNVPPSNILFNREVISFINDNYDYEEKNNQVYTNLNLIANTILTYYIENGNKTHLNIMYQVINTLDITSKSGRRIDPKTIWINFIKQVIFEYTTKKKPFNFDALKYFNEVYRHNVDIHSLLLTFVYLLKYNKISNRRIDNLETNLKKICDDYMFTPKIAVTKIDINELKNKLYQLFLIPIESTSEPIESTPEPKPPTPKAQTSNILENSIKSAPGHIEYKELKAPTPKPPTSSLKAPPPTPKASTSTPKPPPSTPKLKASTPKPKASTPKPPTSTPKPKGSTPKPPLSTPKIVSDYFKVPTSNINLSKPIQEIKPTGIEPNVLMRRIKGIAKNTIRAITRGARGGKTKKLKKKRKTRKHNKRKNR